MVKIIKILNNFLAQYSSVLSLHQTIVFWFVAFECFFRDTRRVVIKRYTCNTDRKPTFIFQQILHNMKYLSVRSQLNSHTAHTVRVFLNLLINGHSSMAFVSSTTVEEMAFFVITDRVICGWLCEGRGFMNTCNGQQ